MRIAVISDIHGNLEALTSLREAYDELWVLGDLVNYGPNPAEVVEFVRAKADLAVRGNHDHAIGFGVDPRCSLPYREMARAMGEYATRVLSDSQKQFLRDLPIRAEREVNGKRVSLCHAIPSDPLFGYCPPESENWTREIEWADMEMLFVGHTHLQFTRRIGDREVVNPGSIGQSKIGRAVACYAIWDGGPVELRRVEYPFESTIRKIEMLSIPTDVKADLAHVLRSGGTPA